MTQFGDTLRAIRNTLRLSQGSLALELGSTQRHISFLETGRSEPSRAMLSRLTTELPLSAAQRAALLAASPFKSAETPRDLTTPDVIDTLNMLEQRVLAHWPFPGFVLSSDWTVLRMNPVAARLFARMLPPDTNQPLNLLVLLTSESFRAFVANWDVASANLYFRLQHNAAHNPVIAAHFTKLKQSGVFDHVAAHMAPDIEKPVFSPLELTLPGGLKVATTSLIGKLGTVHDALVEGFEVELMLPIDPQSEALMLAATQ